MIRCSRLWVLLAALCLLSACEEDEEILASYRQDLAEIVTDASGGIVRLLLDDGTALPVLNVKSGFPEDTLMRVFALYTENEAGATLNRLSNVLSSLPRTFEETAVRRDPVGLTAIWRGGRYVNLLLALKSGGNSHYFSFVDRGIVPMEGGWQKACIELYHDQNKDPLYYTREVYVSCPLWAYEGKLESGRDSVEFVLRTFEGDFVKTLPY